MRPDVSEIRRRQDGSIDTNYYVCCAITVRRARINLLASKIHLIFVRWRERMATRREIAMMSARDFRDLAIPSSLADGECRRWPWQPASEAWDALAASRDECRVLQSGNNDKEYADARTEQN
jgi:hypothetical protein